MKKVLVNGKWPLKVPDHKINQEWWNVWEKERLQSMFETIKPGNLIFDIGAEEGDFTALFAQWAGETGNVIIVEPSVRMWPCIRGIFEANGLRKPLACYQGFCGAEMRPGSLDGGEEWPICSVGEIVPDPGFYNVLERPENAILTIDQIADFHGLPDVVTIDVEGAEFEVMKGAVNTLSKKMTTFFISVHPSFMANDYPYTEEALYKFMEENGYEPELLALDHEEHVKFTPKNG